MKKELSLTIPKSTLIPPPKKSEIIDALTKLEVDKRTKENKEGVIERKRLEDESEKELIKLCLIDPAVFAVEADTGSFWSGKSVVEGIYVKFKIEEKQLPADLKKKLRDLHKLPEHNSNFYFSDVRKEVQAAINGMVSKEERVTALLADEGSRKSLEAMLEAIS